VFLFLRLRRLAGLRWRYATLPPHGRCGRLAKFDSESYITTYGQSASLSWNKAPIWGLRPDFYYCQTVAGLLMWGALSDERTGLSSTAGTRQHSHFRIRVPWNSWLIHIHRNIMVYNKCVRVCDISRYVIFRKLLHSDMRFQDFTSAPVKIVAFRVMTPCILVFRRNMLQPWKRRHDVHPKARYPPATTWSQTADLVGNTRMFSCKCCLLNIRHALNDDLENRV
jgi:hypothetical protein